MKFILFALCCISIQLIHGRLLNDDITFRIVGGEDAEIGNAPYQCALIFTEKYCGCAIVTNKWILTAAHCIDGQIAQTTQVLVGTNYLFDSGDAEEKSRKYYQVEQWISHQHWDRGRVVNDIAVVQIKGTIEFNENVQPIKFSNNTIPNGVDVQITGWGETYDVNNRPNRLQILNTTIADCHKGFKHIGEEHLCTISKEGEGNCRGDSGGPLVWKNEVVGVVSYGTMTCAIGVSDVFARVSHFYDWIVEQIKHV